MFPRFFEITLLLGAAILMLATPSLSLVTEGMNLDDFGVFELAPNGTVFSFDGNGTVIDTKQLNGTEFKTLTGCDMVTPGMPPSAVSETEQCLKKDKIPVPNSNVSMKRDGEVFERAFTCIMFICRVNTDCDAINRAYNLRCYGCLRSLPGPNICTGF